MYFNPYFDFDFNVKVPGFLLCYTRTDQKAISWLDDLGYGIFSIFS